MSDQPLFQNSDEQEQAFAPQQLPTGADATAEGGVAPAAAPTGHMLATGMGNMGPVVVMPDVTSTDSTAVRNQSTLLEGTDAAVEPDTRDEGNPSA